MGFFYNKVTNEKKKKTNKGEQFYSLAYDQECKMCPLNRTGVNSPKMAPSGSSEEGCIYNIGEAPGKTEDEEGIQFVGESGEILRSALANVYDLEEDELQTLFRWNNCVRCRPRSGKANRTPTEIEVECCRKSVEKDIEKIKPAVILGYGNVPLKWFIKTDGIMLFRGRYLPVKIGNHTAWFFPMLHPSYLLRNQRKDKRTGAIIKSMYDHIFEKDLQQVLALYDTLPPPKVITEGYTDNITVVMGDKPEDIETIKKKLAKFKKLKKVALDIETRGLRPYNNGTIYCIAIGTHDDTIVFPLDHPDAWNFGDKDENLTTVMAILEDFLLHSGTKIAHNLKFELEWFLFFFGKEVLYASDWTDTQACSYLLNERTSKKARMHSLDTQCLLNFGFNLKELTTVDRKKPITATLYDLLLYNGMDTKYTFLLEEVLYGRMNTHQKNLLSFLNDTAKTLVQVQSKGLHLNKKRAKEIGDDLLKKINKVKEEITKDPSVLEYQKFFEKEFNPASPTELKVLFEDILKLPAIKTTDGGEGDGSYSTDRTVLDAFASQGVAIASKIIILRETSKLYTTYLESAPEWESPDGVVHGQYNHLGTSTGRLSSSDPVNFQNFPNKKGAYIRDIFYAPKGYIFAAFDQGQIEARCLAMASHDVIFSNAIKHDYDVHLEWAKNVIEAYPKVVKIRSINQATPEILKAFRKRIKNELVFPWFYKAGKYSVGKSLGLPNEVTDQLYDDFWNMFAGVRAWQEAMLQFYEQNGFVETLTRRKRHGPFGPSEIVNSPIQGTASDIVVESGNRIVMRYGEDLNYVYVLEIHDDLTFLLPEDNADDYIINIAKEMVYPAFDFIEDIPLSVELKVGPSWFKLEEVETFKTSDFWSEEELRDKRRIQTR